MGTSHAGVYRPSEAAHRIAENAGRNARQGVGPSASAGPAPAARRAAVEPDHVERVAQPAPDAELDFTGRQQLVLDHLGHGDGLDRAGREIAEAGDDELADRAESPRVVSRSSDVNLA